MAAQPKRIVVGFDGTDGARRALAAAIEIMGYGSTLTVVTVGRDGDREAKGVLTTAHDVLLDKLVTADYVQRIGDAAQELVAAAAELQADLVIVGAAEAKRCCEASPGR